MKLVIKCLICNIVAKLLTSKQIGSTLFSTYECGHTITEKVIIKEKRDIIFNRLYDYQQDCVEFIENSNFNCLVADPMGAGKTIEVLAALRYHQNDLVPAIFIVKAVLKYQWAKEIMKWLGPACVDCKRTGEITLNYTHSTQQKVFENIERISCSYCTNGIKEEEALPWLVQAGNQFIPKGFKFYIFSMDIISKYVDEIKELNPKLIVIDESQHFKEINIRRTIALFKICKEVKHKILLTGTPILNRASEYFTTLNLLRPTEWISKRSFEYQWLNYDWERKQYGGLLENKIDKFHEVTKKYIIRRPRNEILKDLPPFTRNLVLLTIDNPMFVQAYKIEQRKLQDFLNIAANYSGFEQYTHILAILTKLRQITGIAKVDECVKRSECFLSENNGIKLCIGIHHKVVSGLLLQKLKDYKPILLSGENSPERKMEIIDQFQNNSPRLMIASILAAGEGLNLQFCSNAILLERQWNSAKEVQFEGRFDRIGQKNPVTVDYLIAKGSIDEWMTELIELKRSWITSATERKEMNIEESSQTEFMKLAEICASRSLT